MALDFILMMNYELNKMEYPGGLICPQEEVQEGDRLVGEISEDLRKLYTLWRQVGKESGALENEIQWGNKTPETFSKAHEMKSKANALSMLLWISIIDELDLWGVRESLYLRKGFQVIARQAQEVPPFFRFLDMGGGG